MQTIIKTVIRAIIIFSPLLTLWFNARLGGMMIAGAESGPIVAGAAAASLVLLAELVLDPGPKRSAGLRRWLDPRAMFEGIWLQDVFEGQKGNDLGVFSMAYEPEGDTFAVRGHVYSHDGERSAKFRSTHLFIDKRELEATYLWEGEWLDARPTPEIEKTGRTRLELRKPGKFALPMSGEGSVSHIGESTRVRFRLLRVTNQLLSRLGLPFTLRRLRIDADGEESRLVLAFLEQLRRSAGERGQSVGG